MTNAKRARGHIRTIVPATRPDTKQQLSDQLGPCIYAIFTKDKLIKIGFSANIHNRHRWYGKWDRVLLVMPGMLEDEKALHERFARFRARGNEYYKPVRSILEWINEERRLVGVSELRLPPKPAA
jgi:hypothetical protein